MNLSEQIRGSLWLVRRIEVEGNEMTYHDGRKGGRMSVLHMDVHSMKLRVTANRLNTLANFSKD